MAHKAVVFYTLGLFFTCLGLSSLLQGQTNIDDVHVMSRAPLATPAAITAGPGAPHALTAELFRTSADLVLVPVTITDGYNRPVIGLDKDNFQVFENKKAQPIRAFSSEDTPVSIGIILDVSGSMKTKIERAREAVQQFCEAANPQDEFFLITFSETPRLASDFGARPEDMEGELLHTWPKGRTALLDAIYMGMQKMRQARFARKALLIVSDGGDNHSRYTEREVKSAIKEADVLIYTVGIFDHSFQTIEEMLGPELLENTAELTGGQAFMIDNPNDLPMITRNIGVQLRHQYVLGYRPEVAAHDTKWRKIKVKLSLTKQAPFLKIHARTGYYSGAE